MLTLNIDHYRTLRALRLSIALIVTYGITWYFQIPEGTWAAITCCVVLYEYTTLGGVLNKSYLRILGTIHAAMYGCIILYVFANDVYVNLLALIAGVFINAYLFMDTSRSYSSTLGCITLVLVLLNYHHLHDLDAAVLRPFNILLGEAVAITVMSCVFPEYARDSAIICQNRLTQDLISLMKIFLVQPFSVEEFKKQYFFLEKKILSDITECNRYVDEARMEVRNTKVIIDFFSQSIEHFSRVFHLLNAFFHYVNTSKNDVVGEISDSFAIVLSHLLNLSDVIQDPAKKIEKFSQNLLCKEENDPSSLMHQALLQSMKEELKGLETTWENISVLRLNKFKKNRTI